MGQLSIAWRVRQAGFPGHAVAGTHNTANTVFPDARCAEVGWDRGIILRLESTRPRIQVSVLVLTCPCQRWQRRQHQDRGLRKYDLCCKIHNNFAIVQDDSWIRFQMCYHC